jgi:hypothetical protein
MAPAVGCVQAAAANIAETRVAQAIGAESRAWGMAGKADAPTYRLAVLPPPHSVSSTSTPVRNERTPGPAAWLMARAEFVSDRATKKSPRHDAKAAEDSDTLRQTDGLAK